MVQGIFSLEKWSTEQSSFRFWPLAAPEEGTSCRNRGARARLWVVLIMRPPISAPGCSDTVSEALVNREDFEAKGRVLYPGPASAEPRAWHRAVIL